MHIEEARVNMITQQIRAREVLDDEILDIITQTPRELFVPKAYEALAFSDTILPIGHEQIMMKPSEEGLMCQSLTISPQDSILEIGTGTGYVTALLSKLGDHVHTVEIFPEFSSQAQAKCQQLNLSNITYSTGNIMEMPLKEKYDVIIITGSLLRVPSFFKDVLHDGGRLFAVIGKAPSMTATLITQTTKKGMQVERLFETEIPPLIHGPQNSEFQF